MTADVLVITVMLIAFAGFLVLAYRALAEQEKRYWNSLPSLEEARLQIANEYPDYVDCFTLTRKVTEALHGMWGSSVRISGDFLECETLGVSIRVRLGEKMS